MTRPELSRLIKYGENQTVSSKALNTTMMDCLLLVLTIKQGMFVGQRQLNRGRKGWTIFIGPPGSAASPM